MTHASHALKARSWLILVLKTPIHDFSRRFRGATTITYLERWDTSQEREIRTRGLLFRTEVRSG